MGKLELLKCFLQYFNKDAMESLKSAISAMSERFVQLFLTTYSINTFELIISLLGVFIAGIAAFIGYRRLKVAWYPIIQEQRTRQALLKEQSLGSFGEETIKSASNNYIVQKCQNVDPTDIYELRESIAPKSDLFAYIDESIKEDRTYRHLLVLGDSGTGKTSFMLNYFSHFKRRFRFLKIALVALGEKNADTLIGSIEDPRGTVILLDAFDEDPRAIDNYEVRIRHLMDLCKDFYYTIMTCRTQFFPTDFSIPKSTGIFDFGPRKVGERSEFVFKRIFISPFSDKDVAKYIKNVFPFYRSSDREKALEVVKSIPELSVRPMLLTGIKDIVEAKIIATTKYKIYEILVDAWIEREDRWITDGMELKEFSERLAMNIFLERHNRNMEKIPSDELSKLINDWNVEIPEWTIKSRSLLNRDAFGNLKFAHRSFLEFLFISRFLVLKHEQRPDVVLTDLMVEFIENIIDEYSDSIQNFFPRFFEGELDQASIINGFKALEVMCCCYQARRGKTIDHGQIDYPSKHYQYIKAACRQEMLVKNTVCSIFENMLDAVFLDNNSSLHASLFFAGSNDFSLFWKASKETLHGVSRIIRYNPIAADKFDTMMLDIINRELQKAPIKYHLSFGDDQFRPKNRKLDIYSPHTSKIIIPFYKTSAESSIMWGFLGIVLNANSYNRVFIDKLVSFFEKFGTAFSQYYYDYFLAINAIKEY